MPGQPRPRPRQAQAQAQAKAQDKAQAQAQAQAQAWAKAQLGRHGPWGPPGALLGPSLGPSLGPPGALLGPSCGSPGALVGPSCGRPGTGGARGAKPAKSHPPGAHHPPPQGVRGAQPRGAKHSKQNHFHQGPTAHHHRWCTRKRKNARGLQNKAFLRHPPSLEEVGVPPQTPKCERSLNRCLPVCTPPPQVSRLSLIEVWWCFFVCKPKLRPQCFFQAGEQSARRSKPQCFAWRADLSHDVLTNQNNTG